MRTCKKCQTEKDPSDFYLTSRGKPSTSCRACSVKRAQENYRENREERLEWHRNYNKHSNDHTNGRKAKIREWIRLLKDVPCKDCSGRFPPECMDFDHRDPTQKTKGIASMTCWSVERIMEEVDKCDIICANCHRIRTAKQFDWYEPLHSKRRVDEDGFRVRKWAKPLDKIEAAIEKLKKERNET